MSLNKVMLIGNVGSDPEVRYLEGNAKVATLRLATSEVYTDRNGERRENTEWHNIVAWRGNADVCEKYVHKGSQIYVEGKLRTRSWTDQSGTKKYQTEITVDVLQLLGRRDDSQSAGQAQGNGPSQYGHGQYGQGSSSQGAADPKPSYQQNVPIQQGAPLQSAAPSAIAQDDPSDDLPF